MAQKDIIEQAKTYRPRGSRVVVKRLDRGKVSPGGIYIPESAQEDRRLAKVVAIGPGKLSAQGVRIPIDDLKVGDTVLTVKYKGVDLECGDDSLQLLDESDCMVVVEAE